MSTAPRLALTLGTWEDAHQWLGRALPTIEGVDVVAKSDVRRKLEVLRADSTLNTDDDLARSLGYHAAPALTTMLTTWALGPYWAPGQPVPAEGEPTYLLRHPLCDIPAPGDSIIGTQIRTEYHTPVYPGDRISATSELVDITPKRTAVGDGAFMTLRTTYTNQDGETVGVEHLTCLRYQSEGERAGES